MLGYGRTERSVQSQDNGLRQQDVRLGLPHDPGQSKMYCVICWFEGTTELVDWFDSKAEAFAEAKELNQAAEHSKEVSNDFYTAELCSDWS